MPIRGSVDLVTRDKAEGWAYFARANSLVIQAFLDGQIIGEAEANGYRADLEAAGFGEGRCGFVIHFDRPVDERWLPFIVFRPETGDVEFPRTSNAGYAEFFKKLLSQKPAAGRPRSVFGGLWTDRTDASPMLHGMIRVGRISPELTPVLEDFIRGGAVQLQLDPTVSVDKEVDSPRADRLLEPKQITEVLEAVLQDRPVVILYEAFDGGQPEFRQPSGWRDLPSPADCVALLVPPSGGRLELRLIRDGHALPEFRSSGASRWNASEARSIDAATIQESVVDMITVEDGWVLLVSPGALFTASVEGGKGAAKVLCTPLRAAPAKLAPAGAPP